MPRAPVSLSTRVASRSFDAALATAALLGALSTPLQAEEKLQYNRDVRPILAENCFACHGPDSAARKADLRLDKRDAAIEGNAIEPGKPGESELIARIVSTDPKAVMPPPSAHKTLTAEQKSVLQRWITEGAEYQPHWSFIAPLRPAVPAVSNPAWVRNPIDAFVLARLDSMGLQPAAEADRSTLARRAALDITGLPPTPEMVDAFVNDPTPDAYEKYVDRLLAMPEWGEQRARYWLDAARYADTHGLHFDNFRETWAYRANVIDAFNRNQPFDQFTIDQLAGDLLPNRTLEQLVASGFNRCNITTNEGGTIPEEYAVLYTRDRTETVAQVWMGMTAGCAVCHDHKFDPLSQKEFYSLAAFFNNTTQNPMDGNIKDTPPVLPIPSEADRPRWNALDGEIAAAKQSVETGRQSSRPEFDAWAASANAETVAPLISSAGLVLHAPFNDGTGDAANITVNGTARPTPLPAGTKWEPGYVMAHSYRFSGTGGPEFADVGNFEKDQPFAVSMWVKLDKPDLGGALLARMDEQTAGHRGWDVWCEGGRIGMHMVHRWPEDALKIVSKTGVKAGEWTHVAVTYDGSGHAGGIAVHYNGQAQQLDVHRNSLQSSIKTEVPFKIGQRQASSYFPAEGAVSDLRLYSAKLTAADVNGIMRGSRGAALLAKPADVRSDVEKNELYEWWLSAVHQPQREAVAKLAALESEKGAIAARGTIAHVMQEKGDPAMAYVLFRGEYDQRRDATNPETPAILPAYAESLPKNRLGFAQWLLQPDHPLTARVTVNRFWQEMFGTGLVRTSGDFGVAGELPSNQELLDWMAVDFRETGWDVKRFYKLVVTSNTYRQSAATTPTKLEKDPSNRFFSRGPRFRMDAEMIRDYGLAASGLLVRKLGGPSVRPYQPDGVWEAVAMIGSNTRDYVADSGENLYRRSMYTFWKRSAPPANMDIFNAPSREFCAVRRDRTNTPLQALATLNDPQLVEAARFLAQRTLHSSPETAARIDFVAKHVLARSLRPEEASIVTASLNDLSAYYNSDSAAAGKLLGVGASPADATLSPAELAAWTMLVNKLMNLDEVLNK